MSASRTTISFTEQNWEVLMNSSNKSAIVNQALQFFFSAKKVLKQKEEEFIIDELSHYNETEEEYSIIEAFK